MMASCSEDKVVCCKMMRQVRLIDLLECIFLYGGMSLLPDTEDSSLDRIEFIDLHDVACQYSTKRNRAPIARKSILSTCSAHEYMNCRPAGTNHAACKSTCTNIQGYDALISKATT